MKFQIFLRLLEMKENSPLCRFISANRSYNLRNLNLKQQPTIPQIVGYQWIFLTLFVVQRNKILQSEEYVNLNRKPNLPQIEGYQRKFPSLQDFCPMKSYNLRNQYFIFDVKYRTACIVNDRTLKLKTRFSNFLSLQLFSCSINYNLRNLNLKCRPTVPQIVGCK